MSVCFCVGPHSTRVCPLYARSGPCTGQHFHLQPSNSSILLIHCVLPCTASSEYPRHKYAVAQVETMEQVVGGIRYTPTFCIYRNGKKVDEVVGKEPERLADHLWLQAD